MSYAHWKPAQYPATRRSDDIGIYDSETKGKVSVHDPYRWLEQNTEETDQWTTAQGEYTRQFIDANPDLPRLEEEIRQSTDYERVSPNYLR